MVYEVKFKSSVRKDLKNIDREEADRIIDAVLEKLSADPYIGEPLRGKFKGMYKYRIGSYRVIYVIEGKEVWVLKVGHRKHVYR